MSATRTRWLSLTREAPVRDALAVFGASADPERFFWERPSEGRSLAALGETAAIEVGGPDRFATAARLARRLFGDGRTLDPRPGPAAGPLLVGGFSFADGVGSASRRDAAGLWDGFPAGRLVLPAVLYERTGPRAHCTVTTRFAPGVRPTEARARLVRRLESVSSRLASLGESRPRVASEAEGTRAAPPDYRACADRPHADYRGGVARALRAIASGELEKVVLARSVRLVQQPAFDLAATLGALRRTFPSCATFAVARAGAAFLGATPERLVCLEGRRVTTAAVAGSGPRGRSPEEDARLGRALVESKKEQAEHAVVVRAIRESLARQCDLVRAPEAPRLLRLEGIQHLETPIEARLREDASLLDLAGDLHPTPAVGGAPRTAALGWLAREEGLDRGWYAGPVGFVDGAGGGELCVALRSGLLRGGEALLFAGAGIVAGSDPESELRETRLKLRALLAPLLEI